MVACPACGTSRLSSSRCGKAAAEALVQLAPPQAVLAVMGLPPTYNGEAPTVSALRFMMLVSFSHGCLLKVCAV